MIYSLWI